MLRQNHTFKNRILAEFHSAVNSEEFFSALVAVDLTQRQVLHEAGAVFDQVYFVESGVASVLTVMEDGSSVEVGMVGTEGLVGIPALFGGKVSAQTVIVQIGGTAYLIKVAQAHAAFEQNPALRNMVHRFAEMLMNLSAQTAACNRLHSIEQRCARWLLMARDRIGSDTMPMTHDFLASMLGVRRSGVTLVAGELQRSGLIRYQRGELTIVDREALIAVACECYQHDHDRLNPPPA